MSTGDNDLLHHKLSFLEQKLEEYIRQNNTRLDQLLDLTRQIATVNERQNRNQVDIDDIRKRISSNDESNKDSFIRVHSRMDEVRDEVGLIDRELHKWLNRGWGAWAVATLVFSAIQYLVSTGVDTVKAQYSESNAIIKKIEVRVNELESMVTNLISRR